MKKSNESIQKFINKIKAQNKEIISLIDEIRNYEWEEEKKHSVELSYALMYLGMSADRMEDSIGELQLMKNLKITKNNQKKNELRNKL